MLAMLGNIFDALYLRGIQINQALKATHTQAASTIISGVMTTSLSYVLVQIYADVGLILGFAIGMALQASVSNLLANREFAKEQQNYE